MRSRIKTGRLTLFARGSIMSGAGWAPTDKPPEATLEELTSDGSIEVPIPSWGGSPDTRPEAALEELTSDGSIKVLIPSWGGSPDKPPEAAFKHSPCLNSPMKTKITRSVRKSFRRKADVPAVFHL